MKKRKNFAKRKWAISLVKLLTTIMPLLSACRKAQENAKMSLGTVADYLTCAPQERKGSRQTLDEIVLSVLGHIYMSAVLSTTSQESRKTVFLIIWQS